MVAQNSTEHPKDVSLQIPFWLEHSLHLVEEYSIPAIADELKTLDIRQKIPGFRLAFIGDFSRGKSTLINRLLGQHLLPARTIATTATFTSLVAARETEEYMRVFLSPTSLERRPLQETSWHDLLMHNGVNQSQQAIPRVQLLLNHQWLQQLDIEIIDMPGLDNLDSARSMHIAEALSQCDTNILVVSALLPFSLTEAALLEHQLHKRHIPRVTVAVTKLDLLPEDQRAEQFSLIQDRVAQVAPLVPVLPTYPLDANSTEAEVLEALRSHIAMLANKADRHVWRSQQVAATIADYLDQFRSILQTTITSTQMTNTEREKALQLVQNEEYDVELEWERIDLELNQRCFKVETKLRQQLQADQKSLLATATASLTHATDIPLWWQKNFPFFLRHEFLILEQKYESVLMEELTRDATWLQTELMQRFAVELDQSRVFAPQPISIGLQQQELHFSNVNWKRLLIRIGAAASAIAAALYLTGASLDTLKFGGTVSQAATNLAEPLLRKELEQQRERAYQEMQRSIERSTYEYAERISIQLHDLYQHIAKDMQQERHIRQGARRNAIEDSKNLSDTTHLQVLSDKVLTLRDSILAFLKK